MYDGQLKTDLNLKAIVKTRDYVAKMGDKRSKNAFVRDADGYCVDGNKSACKPIMDAARAGNVESLCLAATYAMAADIDANDVSEFRAMLATDFGVNALEEELGVALCRANNYIDTDEIITMLDRVIAKYS